jgi:hypothetical protein
MQFEKVMLDCPWKPIEELDQRIVGQYLHRKWYRPNGVYKDCVGILVVTESTAFNEGWVFLNGGSTQMKCLQSSEHYQSEFCGPLEFVIMEIGSVDLRSIEV